MSRFCCFLGMIFCFFIFSTFAKADSSYSAFDLVKEAKSNRVRFDKNFKNKQFDVTGKVHKTEAKSDSYIIYLEGDKNGNPFETIACEFDPKYENAIMKMNVGDVITVNCFYIGEEMMEMDAFTLKMCNLK